MVWTQPTNTKHKKNNNYIIFKSHQKQCVKDLRVTLNGNVIDNVYSTKLLGVMIDEHLTWKYHINYITKKGGKISRNYL